MTLTVLINLLLIQLLVVFIVDLSGVMTHIKKAIWKWLKGKDKPYKDFEMKPFDCSLCTTWWTGLIYLLITHSFTIPYILVVAGLAFLASTAASLLQLIKDTLDNFIYILDKWINRQ